MTNAGKKMAAKFEKEAHDAMKSGQQELAILKITELLKHSPDQSARWLTARGECFLNLDQAEKALADGKTAIECDSQNINAVILCGKSACKLQMFVDALDYFKAGLKIDPSCKEIVSELQKLQKHILNDQRKISESGDTSYSALDLCSQAIYPGDDKLLIMEKEILQVKYKILEDEVYKIADKVVQKDDELEMQLVQAAGDCYSANKFEEALTIVSKAVSLNPRNVFLRTFRAQIYFELKQWANGIRDYWVIPKTQRTAEVWKQGGKAFFELWLPVLAEFWLRKATQMSGGKDKEAAILFQKIRVKRLYDPLTEDQPVTVDFTQFGRAVLAKEDIKKGETVMTDVPMVMAQTLICKDVAACWNCAVSLISAEDYFGNKMSTMDNEQLALIEEFWPSIQRVPCPHCQQEIYCSKICQKEAWDRYHRIICPNENKEGHQLYALIANDGYGYNTDGEWTQIWGGHYSFMVLAKIWAMMASQVKDMMAADGASTPTLEHWARAKAPFRRFIAYGIVPATKRMPHMLPVFNAVFKDCGDGVSLDITETEFNGRYYQAACNLQCFSPTITPYHRFLDNLKSDMRAIGMLKYLADKPQEGQFAAMCPLHACTNHSCCNNAEVCDLDMNGRPAVQMIAKRDIKKGEEIFITYIDTNLPKLLRRAWLFKSFNFWCHCQRCQFEGEHSDECTNCHTRCEEDKQFPACGKCKRAWYCGVKCQRESWKKGHKIVCQTTHSKAIDLV